MICCYAGAAGQRPVPKDPTMGETAQNSSGSAAEKYFTNVELVNQHGQKLRLYSDLLKGQTVVINAFFSTCTSVCQPMMRNLEQIQAAIAPHLGKDVLMISISVDPETDTPQRLEEYAKRFHARTGWHFLTGKKENVDWALYKLGQYVTNKDDHLTLLIVGNERTGLWSKALAMAKPEELVALIEKTMNDKP